MTEEITRIDMANVTRKCRVCSREVVTSPRVVPICVWCRSKGACSTDDVEEEKRRADAAEAMVAELRVVLLNAKDDLDEVHGRGEPESLALIERALSTTQPVAARWVKADRCQMLINNERLRKAREVIDGWSEDHALWAAAIAKDHDEVARAKCEHALWALAACILTLRGQPIDTTRYDIPMEVHRARKFKASLDDARTRIAELEREVATLAKPEGA